jgi:hypothetical protein
MIFFHRNTTSKISQAINAEILVISIGKSGRTWLRVLLEQYFSNIHNKNHNIQKKSDTLNSPNIFFTHELWEHRSKANILHQLTRKYLIPQKVLNQRKIILLYRDPRDVVVSLYHHKTKRSKKKYTKSISKFIRDEKYGIKSIINVMNTWRKQFLHHQNCFWISYEDMKKETPDNLIKIVEFITHNNADIAEIQNAVQFCDFKESWP